MKTKSEPIFTDSEREEFDRILHNLCVLPSFETTTTKKIAKQILLNDWYFCRGDIRIPKAKHLGLGVYKITSEAKYKNE